MSIFRNGFSAPGRNGYGMSECKLLNQSLSKLINWNSIGLQIPITLHKETVIDGEGREVHRCGFKIGGGIDQDFRKSPQGYTDNVPSLCDHCYHRRLTPFYFQGIYVTEVQEGSSAARSGLRVHDKILQVPQFNYNFQTHTIFLTTS